MADPISLASGVLTLVIFAHKSCLTLHTTIQSFKTHPKRVRDLIEELEALIDVLESLDDTMRSHTDVDLPALDLPLRRCGSACNEFLEELQRCSSRSGGDQRSFRDWAKLRYMGDNIDDFKDSLAAHKSTLNIALTDMQLRKSSVALERLGEYKDLIRTATNDLEARLETIDEKLQSLVDRTTSSSASTELQSTKDERSSTQKCLVICAQFSKLIDELQLSSAKDTPKGPDDIPEKITNDGIEECRISMEQTAARLESHMQETLDRMLSSSSATMTQEDITYLARLREEWATARKCRDICALANQNSRENIYAGGDETLQSLVSNNQTTSYGKNRGYGAQIQSVGGHLSDESIQKVSSGYFQMSLAENKERFWPTHRDTLPIPDEARKFKIDSKARTSSSTFVSTLEQWTDTRTWPTDVNKDKQTTIDTLEDLFDVKKAALAGRSARQLTGLISDASFQTMVGPRSTLEDTGSLQAQRQDITPEQPELAETQSFVSVSGIDFQALSEHGSSLEGSTLLEQMHITETEQLQAKEHESKGIDYMSVISNDEDIASKAPRSRTVPELLAVKLFGAYFAELDDLRDLHNDLLEKLGTERFVDNYRRILKMYVLKLKEEAQTALEKDAVKVIEDRKNRRFIALEIVAHSMPETDDIRKQFQGLAFQPPIKQPLEEWSWNVYGAPDHAPTPEDSADEESDSDTDDSIENIHLETLAPTNMGKARRFLQKSAPLQTLILQLRLLSLPSTLREIMGTTPKYGIRVSTENDTSFLNRYKRHVESYTSSPWDWWPLKPCVPNLTAGQSRLEWTFCDEPMYTLISHQEAKTIEQVLLSTSEHPPKCYCCKPRPCRMDWATACQLAYQILRNSLSITRTGSLPSSSSLPAGFRPQYTPTRSVDSTSFTGPQDQDLSLLQHLRQSTGITPCANTDNTNDRSTANLPCIVFGVESIQGFHSIESIEVQAQFDDPSLIRELKRRHQSHRWWFQQWFSPFRFRYCREILKGYISCVGEALPDDHGYTNEYDYNPRPPTIKNPPIDAACFSVLLRACDSNCYWSLSPFGLHNCRHVPTENHYVARIPRKKGTYNDVSHFYAHFPSITSRVAFGIDAAYSISHAGMFVYHFLLIFSGFIFWIYWLKTHPSDLQNASVPLFTIIMLLGTFWTLYGRRVGALNDNWDARN